MNGFGSALADLIAKRLLILIAVCVAIGLFAGWLLFR